MNSRRRSTSLFAAVILASVGALAGLWRLRAPREPSSASATLQREAAGTDRSSGPEPTLPNSDVVAREPISRPGELTLPDPKPSALDPAILEIEDRFLIKGKRFSELELDKMTLEEVRGVLGDVAQYQVREQADFFARVPSTLLRTMSEDDYVKQQVWLIDDIMAFPVRKDGKLVGEFALVEGRDCPTVYGLREMVRAIHRVGAYADDNERQRREFLQSISENHPDGVAVENRDHTMTYVFGPDGAVVAARLVSTVGNH